MEKINNCMLHIKVARLLRVVAVFLTCANSVFFAKELTTKEKTADFEYLYTIIKKNYPYLEINKRQNGIDWLANKRNYAAMIKKTKNDEEFKQGLDIIMGDLHSGHANLMGRDFLLFHRAAYYLCAQNHPEAWQSQVFPFFDNEKLIKRYELPPLNTTDITTSDPEEIANNVTVQDIIENKIGYIHIKSCLQEDARKNDEEKIKTYCKKISTYQALVIDIRGNGGGDDNYWHDMLLPAFIDRKYTNKTYLFFRNGSVYKRYYHYITAAEGKKPDYIHKLKDLNLATMPKLPEEVKTIFSFYYEQTDTVAPSQDSVYFKGKIYLLVDSAVFSSAEGLAVFCKYSGLATLIGEQTGGDGIGTNPWLEMLPNSGFAVRFTMELGTTADGTCNEEYKTVPYYIVDDPSITNDFTDDQCIQKVIEQEGIQQ